MRQALHCTAAKVGLSPNSQLRRRNVPGGVMGVRCAVLPLLLLVSHVSKQLFRARKVRLSAQVLGKLRSSERASYMLKGSHPTCALHLTHDHDHDHGGWPGTGTGKEPMVPTRVFQCVHSTVNSFSASLLHPSMRLRSMETVNISNGSVSKCETNT
jgi:hypothetical protein